MYEIVFAIFVYLLTAKSVIFVTGKSVFYTLWNLLSAAFLTCDKNDDTHGRQVGKIAFLLLLTICVN